MAGVLAVYSYQADIDLENGRHQQAVLDLKRIYHHYNQYLQRSFQLLMTELNRKHQMEIHTLFIQHVVQEPILPTNTTNDPHSLPSSGIGSIACTPSAARDSTSTLKPETCSNNNLVSHADNDMLNPRESINTETDGESIANPEPQMNIDHNDEIATQISNNAAVQIMQNESFSELNLPPLELAFEMDDITSTQDRDASTTNTTNDHNSSCDSEITPASSQANNDDILHGQVDMDKDSDSDYEPPSSSSQINYSSIDDGECILPAITQIHTSNARSINRTKKKRPSKFKCPYATCNKTCQAKWKLERHIRTHTGERPFKCNHPGCGKAMAAKWDMIRHTRIHTGEKPFKCNHPGCGRAFTRSESLSLHTVSHTGQKPFKCNHPGCGQTFGHKKWLKRHMHKHKQIS
eukprot:228518_1